MKKTMLLVAMALLSAGHITAQVKSADDLGVFNHVGVGVGVGTPGVTLEVAAPLTPYVAVRGGVNIFPTIKVKTDLDIEVNGSQVPSEMLSRIPSEIEVEGKPSMTTGHLLFDVFPFKKSAFHLTVGAFFGNSKIITVRNAEEGSLRVVNDINQQLIQQGIANPTTHENMVGVDLGDFFLTPDDRGNVDATLRVAGFRPYVGLGFGRPVPAKHRFAFNFNMGVQIWGEPKVWLRDNELSKTTTNSDAGAVLEVLSKVTVYPVMTFKLVGRIL